MYVPDFLTRYFPKGEYPFHSLTDLPLDEADKIKEMHSRRNGITGFYSQPDYLIHRQAIEKWLYNKLIEKGGNPKCSVPVYMCLGKSPDGDFDIRIDIQKNCDEIRIPLCELDLSTITFTYPDSMYELVFNLEGKPVDSRRTDTPKVYTYDELPKIIERYKVYADYRHYIEAQVWDIDTLNKYWFRFQKDK